MSLVQRIILWLGCNALILLWLQPPVYLSHPDGTRMEHQLEYFWNLDPEWSVNVPLTCARMALIVLVTVGMALVFRTNKKPEAKL